MEYIRELFPRVNTRKYAKNQIICYQGDKPQHVFYVLKGHVKYYDIDEHGNEKILHIIGPENIFPMLYAFDVSKEIDAFYSTIDAAEVITIPLDEFRKVTQTNVKFCYTLTQWFLTEIEQLVFRINSFEKTDSHRKVMHALKYLATNYGQAAHDWQRIDFTTTQQFIADFTGLTRETVSATMNELEKDKIIRSGVGRKIEVKGSELKKLAKSF